jgi:hypothetical protein
MFPGAEAGSKKSELYFHKPETIWSWRRVCVLSRWLAFWPSPLISH